MIRRVASWAGRGSSPTADGSKSVGARTGRLRTVRTMNKVPEPPTLEQMEAAVETTLVHWGGEFDVGVKFWWMDWNRMIRDVLTAMRTGVPVDYGDS